MATSYLDSSADDLLNLYNQSFTISGWFQSDQAGPTYTAETWMIAPYFSLGLNTDGTLTFKINNNDGGVGASVTSGAPIAAVPFNFVVVVYSIVTHTISIYLNNDPASVPIVNNLLPGFTNYADTFRIGNDDRGSDGFAADEVTVYSRDLAASEVNFLFNNGGALITSPTSVYNLIFQASLLNDPPRPLVLAAGVRILTADRFYDGTTNTFRIATTDLFSGVELSAGFNWTADNFFDKVILAQHDNTTQYWTPPLPMLARDVPGLPTNDANWDGTCVFADHILLWKADRLKWSDRGDFTLWLPVDETVVSGIFTLNADFQQPAPGGTVTVSITNPVAEVISISLSGSLDFGSVAVGDSAQAILEITNSGTSPLTVTGLTLPTGYSGAFTGTIAVNQSSPVVITFAPTQAIDYSGNISVASNATTGTHIIPVTGTGTGSFSVIELDGVLDFGAIVKNTTIDSSLIIKNTGTATLNVTGISLPSGFTGTFSGAILAGAQQIVDITFSPVGVVTYGGLIHVSSDATSGTAQISVSGSGVNNINKGIFLTDNGSLQFGTVNVGDTPTGTLRIYNSGTDHWSVVGISFPAGFTGSFSGAINPGAFQDVTVTFTPVDGVFYGGTITVAINKTLSAGSTAPTLQVSGSGAATGKVIALSGSLDFGGATVNSFVQAILKISNNGSDDLTVTSITYPTGFTGAFAGTIAPGSFVNVVVTFAPTDAIDYSGTVTVNSDKTAGTATTSASGTGVPIAQPQTLEAGQFVTIQDTQDGLAYYNYYTVVSMSDTTIVLQRLDLTGETPTGDTITAGHQVVSVDANESGEERVVGSINGEIYKVLPQGDFAYIFKERGILSIQYTGLGNGTFFIHPEVSGEGLIGRNALTNLNDGRMILLGHKELYQYAGGAQLTPVAQQVTKQLFKELDRTRLGEILLFNNEDYSEVWVVYPITGGSFRVLIWNYVEDTASFDDYDPDVQFTALGLVDWTADPTWAQFPDVVTWNDVETAWEDLVSASNDHIPLLGSKDGALRLWGVAYSREGLGYHAESQTVDYDLGDGDAWKYVDAIKLGLQIPQPDNQSRLLWIQVGARADLNDADIVWTDPQSVLVNGHAPTPVKINPGGAGRYLRVKFYSDDPDVQWRISSFEILARLGNTY